MDTSLFAVCFVQCLFKSAVAGQNAKELDRFLDVIQFLAVRLIVSLLPKLDEIVCNDSKIASELCRLFPVKSCDFKQVDLIHNIRKNIIVGFQQLLHNILLYQDAGRLPFGYGYCTLL